MVHVVSHFYDQISLMFRYTQHMERMRVICPGVNSHVQL